MRTHNALLHRQGGNKHHAIGPDSDLKKTLKVPFTGALDVLCCHDGRIMTETVQRTTNGGRGFLILQAKNEDYVKCTTFLWTCKTQRCRSFPVGGNKGTKPMNLCQRMSQIEIFVK